MRYARDEEIKQAVIAAMRYIKESNGCNHTLQDIDEDWQNYEQMDPGNFPRLMVTNESGEGDLSESVKFSQSCKADELVGIAVVGVVYCYDPKDSQREISFLVQDIKKATLRSADLGLDLDLDSWSVTRLPPWRAASSINMVQVLVRYKDRVAY